MKISIPPACSQLILVRNKDWESPEATLCIQERDNGNAPWHTVFGPIPAVTGKKGMAWGLGIHPTPENAIRKLEGDLKAPAGLFSLGFIFGYGSESPNAAWPYLRLHEHMLAIDDPQSKYYNCIVDSGVVKTPDWKSAETMLREDGLYKFGMVIEHNQNPAEPGKGSCIFMHIWRGPDQGTEGCTALSEENLLKVLQWLDPEKQPLLLQLAEAE